MAYDAETFFDDMRDLIDATALNTKGTELNTEKGDSELKTDWVATDFILNYNEAVLNLNEFIYYGYADVETDNSIGPKTSETFKMFFIIWLFCTDDEVLEMRKLLRYTRALEEIVEAKSTSFKTSTLEIETFKPVTAPENSGSNYYKAAGIHVTGVIG